MKLQLNELREIMSVTSDINECQVQSLDDKFIKVVPNLINSKTKSNKLLKVNMNLKNIIILECWEDLNDMFKCISANDVTERKNRHVYFMKEIFTWVRLDWKQAQKIMKDMPFDGIAFRLTESFMREFTKVFAMINDDLLDCEGEIDNMSDSEREEYNSYCDRIRLIAYSCVSYTKYDCY